MEFSKNNNLSPFYDKQVERGLEFISRSVVFLARNQLSNAFRALLVIIWPWTTKMTRLLTVLQNNWNDFRIKSTYYTRNKRLFWSDSLTLCSLRGNITEIRFRYQWVIIGNNFLCYFNFVLFILISMLFSCKNGFSSVKDILRTKARDWRVRSYFRYPIKKK